MNSHLVKSKIMTDESEEACLVNPKSPTQANAHGGMPYTDGHHSTDSNRGQSSRQSHLASRQSQGNDEPYDINDDIILSQFHADAIKQVTKLPPILCGFRCRKITCDFVAGWLREISMCCVTYCWPGTGRTCDSSVFDILHFAIGRSWILYFGWWKELG